MVTERCNSYSRMCSQPPKAVDDGWLMDEMSDKPPLIDQAIPFPTFAGGEPLTEWQRFIRLLEQARKQLPAKALHVLTNGR